MSARFYAPGAASGERLVLPDDEAQHLTRVLRMTAGATIRVFDGRGREFEAVVESAGKAGASVIVGVQRVAPAREARVAVTLAQAVLKGDKMDHAVRDAVMMGVAAIQPVVTTRSEVTLASLQRRGGRERWQRIAVSSAKQCGRAVVPPVFEPLELDDVVDGRSIGSAYMLVEPHAAEKVVPLALLPHAIPDEASIFTGPEGGWTAEEIDRAAAVAHLVTLGSRTYRADAMATVALAAFFTLWKEF
ncbi:MAG: RsmE family RNA methyltransferase [Vicinamibacterales bacterium]